MDRELRLRVALGLNVAIVAVQVAFGITAHSLGLLADAGHNATDAGAVLLSLIAVRWARRAPTERRSFGYHRGAVLAAQANAAGVLAVTAGIAFAGVERLVHPRSVHGSEVVAVALGAFCANAAAAAALHARDNDLNMRSALLHMAADAAASLGVAVAGVVIVLSHGTYWIDPVISLAIGVLISVQAIRLLGATTSVLLESTPGDIDLEELGRAVASVTGVDGVHDLHVWGLTDEMRVLSAHVLVSGHPTLEEAQAVAIDVKRTLAQRYRITHATIELECEGCVDDGSWCTIDGAVPEHHGHHH